MVINTRGMFRLVVVWEVITLGIAAWTWFTMPNHDDWFFNHNVAPWLVAAVVGPALAFAIRWIVRGFNSN